MSIVSRSSAARALATLAMVAGIAIAAPEPARADSFSIIITDGDRHGQGGRGHWRGDRGHDRGHWRGHRRHDNGRRWRRGPPPWAYGPSHAPHWRPQARAYVRHCQVVWSHWHRTFVQVCR